MKEMTLRELQLAEYHILCEVVDYIETQGLNYILCGGTMLGAVRHKGFIPWDDDVDILMMRDDYDKLMQLSRKSSITSDIIIRTPGEKKHAFPFMKAYDRRTYLEDKSLREDYYSAVNIDIFPLDRYPSSRFLHRLYLSYNFLIRAALATGILQNRIKRSFPIRLICRLLYFGLGGYQRITILLDNTARWMNNTNKESCYIGDGPFPEGPQDYFDEAMIQPTLLCTFEDREFNIPQNYDAYLRAFYGDYMTLPPIEKRARHHVIGYWRD